MNESQLRGRDVTFIRKYRGWTTIFRGGFRTWRIATMHIHRESGQMHTWITEGKTVTYSSHPLLEQ